MNDLDLKVGDYIYNAGPDNEDARQDALRIMRNQGCKAIRYEQRETEHNTMLYCHGYLATQYGEHIVAVR